MWPVTVSVLPKQGQYGAKKLQIWSSLVVLNSRVCSWLITDYNLSSKWPSHHRFLCHGHCFWLHRYCTYKCGWTLGILQYFRQVRERDSPPGKFHLQANQRHEFGSRRPVAVVFTVEVRLTPSRRIYTSQSKKTSVMFGLQGGFSFLCLKHFTNRSPGNRLLNNGQRSSPPVRH